MRTITNENFVRHWMEVYRKNGNIQDLATKVNEPVAALRSKSYALRAKGVKLPKLQSAIRTLDVDALNALIEE